MFQFELHPYTGEIRTKILVYEKVGVIKHVKAPAINKVDLLHLWKKWSLWRCEIGLNILLPISVAVLCLSYCWPHTLEYHYDITVSDHTKYVIPHWHTFGLLSHTWLPRRRRFPAEIAARWRYRPPIKNMTAHYNSQFCVRFHCCLLQEAQNCLLRLKKLCDLIFLWLKFVCN